MSSTSVIDLAQLPAPIVIEPLDFETILAATKADFQTRWDALRLADATLPAIDVLALESDPLVVAFEAAAYRELVLRARVNDAALANLVAFASGSDLDQVGANASPPTARLASESDERFRVRIVLGAKSRNAGSAERYAAVAMAADIRVADAVAYREGRSPTIKVAVLSTDTSGVADPLLLSTVTAALDEDQNRIVNGGFEVVSAVRTVTPVSARLVVQPGVPSSITATAEAALRAAFTAEAGLGFDLTRDWLRARLMVPGVYSVTIDGPTADLIVPPYEMPSIGTVSLSIAGSNY